MSTIKLLLPGGKSFEIASPFTKQISKLSGLSLILNIISLTAVSLFAFLLPISGTLFNSDTETSSLKFLLIFVFAFLIIFILKLFIQDNGFIIDPKGMLMILVFNLILTTLSITITTLRVSSTFGTTGFRYLSGLALMSLIGLFYFLNLYASNTKGLNRILNFISAGSIFYVLWYLISFNQTSSQFINNLPLVIVGFAILITRVLLNSTKRLGSVAVLAVGLLILVAIPFNASTFPPLFVVTVLLFIATTLVIALYFLKNKKYLRARLSQIKTNIVNFIRVKKVRIPMKQGLADLHLVTILMIPVLLLITAIFFYIKMPETSKANLLTDISSQYSEGMRIILAGSNSINGSNIRSILVGVGNDNYNPARSFFVNVLVISGLIGGAIYLFLWMYFIKAAKDLFSRSIREKKEYKIRALLLFAVILIPLILLISFNNLATVILLWVLYAIISSKQSNLNINYLDNTVVPANSKPIRLIISSAATIAILIGIFYSINLIFTVLK